MWSAGCILVELCTVSPEYFRSIKPVDDIEYFTKDSYSMEILSG